MKRFYLILAALAVAGAAVLVLASRERPMPGAIEVPCPWSRVTASPGSRSAATRPRSRSSSTRTSSAPSAPGSPTSRCPPCAATIETGLVRWRFRDYPLPSHQFSRLAAHAAQCAGEQGRFWEMHDALYANHSAWAQTGRDPTRLFNQRAEQSGVEMGAYRTCMESNRHAARIEVARQEGEARGVGGTPTFFVNGVRFGGSPTSDGFKAVVDSITALPRP
jgi:hypothetical protein